MLGDSSRSSVFHALHRRHANPRKCSTALSHAFRRLLGLVRNRSGQGQGFWLTVLARRTEGMRVRGRVKSSGFTASCRGLGGSGSETRFASQPRESWVRQMPVFDFGLAGWICLAWPAPGLFSETGTAKLHGARAALVTSNSKIELSWRVWDVFAEPSWPCCSSACVRARVQCAFGCTGRGQNASARALEKPLRTVRPNRFESGPVRVGVCRCLLLLLLPPLRSSSFPFPPGPWFSNLFVLIDSRKGATPSLATALDKRLKMQWKQMNASLAPLCLLALNSTADSAIRPTTIACYNPPTQNEGDRIELSWSCQCIIIKCSLVGWARCRCFKNSVCRHVSQRDGGLSGWIVFRIVVVRSWLGDRKQGSRRRARSCHWLGSSLALSGERDSKGKQSARPSLDKARGIFFSSLFRW